ncbi:glycosyltransferase family 4 protein [Oligella urethralis]|uniref:Putative glycosyl transferase n=1 Tax=Oligella urethralis TaxID=90245 RepID=A0A2N6Q9N4_9BURK|nr:glycosyltransferase family 4 protein [Oligella urethralis]PMC15693.1 glycosyltransferase WbuB [Oligella urethralis]SPY08739.1 putative glycosyl transferase [Oligella urethralis]
MKIALITQYFWPESFTINEIVEVLVEQGHTVEVFTAKPNYPDGDIFPGYSAKGVIQEDFIDGVQVNRVPLTPRGQGGARNLIKNYLSFVINGVRYFPKMAKGKEFDVIFVFTLSPITSVLPAIWLKWRMRKHLAIWVLDLWPESLSATGYVKNKLALKIVEQLVKFIYACSDTILVQSHAFVDAVGKYANKNKIIYYPNSYLEPEVLVDNDVSQDLLATLESNFCVVFAGNLGKAQALRTLVDAAEKLSDLPNFKLVFLGSGSMMSWLEEQKTQRNLSNLVLAGRFPANQMPVYFSKAGCLLVSLGKDDILAKTVPAKIQSYLAAGQPILASIDGEAAKVVNASGAGYSSDAEDVDGLVQNILKMYNLSENERKKMGMRGREYFLENFEMHKQVANLINILQERISK